MTRRAGEPRNANIAEKSQRNQSMESNAIMASSESEKSRGSGELHLACAMPFVSSFSTAFSNSPEWRMEAATP